MPDENPKTLYESWDWIEAVALATSVVISVAAADIWDISTITQIVFIIVGTLVLERAFNRGKSMISK